MTTSAKHLDLSILPPEYRAAFEAQAVRVAELEETNQRQEHLIAEMHHALYGKKSEKLADDDRQLAFEDLEVALAEVEEKKSEQSPDEEKPKRKKIAKRNRGNLPEGLPRIEQVIEPDSLDCPCGCGKMHRIGEDRRMVARRHSVKRRRGAQALCPSTGEPSWHLKTTPTWAASIR
ncbi:hypothetical protein ROLI_048090 (plasmid) [Roseobacter fucihabitans]|uniref:Transposase TnpC homeodomain domain-containing protein n=1 Tax=Roseobacter fucihabitans TaxID=1537242 RepID=A0ABZ2C0J7_9RHOB|nr:transposase [Roseobacter litoralis]MBC6967300.1 Transposase C of IS166 homeodomain protein [Roseobacter litoralis]